MLQQWMLPQLATVQTQQQQGLSKGASYKASQQSVCSDWRLWLN
jgi:hypothetical protein